MQGRGACLGSVYIRGGHSGVSCAVGLDNPPESKRVGAVCTPRGLSPPRAWAPYVIAGALSCTGYRCRLSVTRGKEAAARSNKGGLNVPPSRKFLGVNITGYKDSHTRKANAHVEMKNTPGVTNYQSHIPRLTCRFPQLPERADACANTSAAGTVQRSADWLEDWLEHWLDGWSFEWS